MYDIETIQKLELTELNTLEDKIANLRFFINRNPDYTKMKKTDQQMLKEMLRIFETSRDDIIKTYNDIHKTQICRDKQALEYFASGTYRFKFGEVVTPLGDLFNQKLMITSIDISYNGSVYNIDIPYITISEKFDGAVDISIPIYTGDVHRAYIMFNGTYANGELCLNVRHLQPPVSSCETLHILSYVVEKAPAALYQIC